jgi:hypothetical protein
MGSRKERAAAIAAEQLGMANVKDRALARYVAAFGAGDERRMKRMLDAIGLHQHAAAMADHIAALADRHGRRNA